MKMRPVRPAASSEGVTGKLFVQDILNELVVIVCEDELIRTLIDGKYAGEGDGPVVPSCTFVHLQVGKLGESAGTHLHRGFAAGQVEILAH